MSDAAYAQRLARVAEFIAARGIAACVFRDEEGRRDPALRYLCGQHADAVLVVTAEGRSVLVSWDLEMAQRNGHADKILPYTDYGRNLSGILSKLLAEMGIKPGARVEIPPDSYYPEFERLSRACDYKLLCKEEDCAAQLVVGMRSIKDDSEIALYRRAAALTDKLLVELAEGLGHGRFQTESQIALFLEGAARDLGCEAMGFETLCAGPERSFGIHAFPSWTAAGFGGRGFSILDFGLKLEGYCTDVTLSVLRGKLSDRQKEMLGLVEDAYAASLAAARNGRPVIEAARACDDVFAAAGWKMPHALGHGIGLEAHEAPVLRNRADNDWIFKPGMVFTLEPGLYSPGSGGLRWENDFLMTESGPEALTHCKILSFDE